MAAVPSGKEWFTVPQVAGMLGVSLQAIYDAVKDGRMRAQGTGWDRRIHAAEVLTYAIHTGRNVEPIVSEIQKVAGDIEVRKLLSWVLAAVGLAWLLTKLDEKS